jgi:hypothetical protein
MVLPAEFAVIVPTVGFDFFENINMGEVFKELANEQSIEGNLKRVAGNFLFEVAEDVGNGRVHVGW